MQTAKQIVEQFRESIPHWGSKSMRYNYPGVVARFVDYIGAKETYTKTDAVRWLNHLIAEGKSKGSVRWYAYVLTSFYKSRDLTPPFRGREYPTGPSDDELIVNAPALTKPAIHEMIEAVLDRGSHRMMAYLAISTTYGLRAEELARIKKSDIANNMFTVHTAKGGTERVHKIPEEIAECINDYDFPKIQTQSIINLFKSIQKLSKHKHKNREGWHSIRRRLIQELEDAGVVERHIYTFMRWRATRRGIMGAYSKPKPDEADSIVFTNHPFLKYWKEAD